VLFLEGRVEDEDCMDDTDELDELLLDGGVGVEFASEASPFIFKIISIVLST
jgi:hypothetical protein